ncbi:hypothetical protein D8796_06875 [Streptococcus cristatus]|uniref:Uncharacterized protein n=2 Tax=Streptococcus cristatus TaxID=45634 RepID=A0A3R9LXE1_STRCR|nr:hypothetical protein [Streptococcus cristatus]RSJ77289.1 hypothetical protein D8795_09835 [Streptococcus cristatus]RSJ79391.1 hypothetical protein D8796_06875 [Streptococcus cristatus]RSJ85185.1 hypothetical protein D8793_07750 [Streptococcus cristatus]RSJ85283.1 hypothetical protein D8794_07400 [Streptococcus cristatus]
MDAVLFVRTKSVNLETSLRLARPLVEADLRDIDTETVSVVSAITPDETTLRNARQLSAAELRDIDIVEVNIVRAAYFDKIRT